VKNCTLDRFAMVLFFLTIVLAAALSPMASDTWWQLRAGGDMWTSGHVLLTDTYSHTAYGGFWPNHEWLSQVAFYGLYRLGGLALLSLFSAAAIVAAWGITWHLATGPTLQRLIVLLPALVPASEHWAPRPHALSLLFLPLAVWLVIERRYVWLLPLFWIWANWHGGVLLGLVVVTAALGAAVIHEPRAFPKIGLAFVGCLVAVTLTPLGASFWIEIPKSLSRIHQYPLNEWQAPTLGEIPLLPFWVIAAVLCGLVMRHWRRLRQVAGRDLAILCLSAFAILPLALSAVRNVGPFLMLAAPAVCALMPRVGAWAERRRQHRPALNLALTMSACLAVAIVIGYAYRFQIRHLQWTPLPEASLLALKRCPDNLYNRYDEGGYLIWFEPDRRVFLDGRQDPYQPRLVLDQIQIESSGDYATTFSTHDIRCAYLPATSPVAVRLSASGWSALYRDSTWVVLAQRPAAGSTSVMARR
jgi:hypothetical protein